MVSIDFVDEPSHSTTALHLTDSADEFVKQVCDSVHQMAKAGVPDRDLLVRLASAGEILAGKESTVSILVLDQDGLLRNGASPNLPADYLQAIDGLKPNPMVGTCAAAAATGCVVITQDFCDDDKWAELRHLPRSLGFVGAWSMPIKSLEGSVLGTFGTYFRERRTPTPRERKDVGLLATAAAWVLASRSRSHVTGINIRLD